MLLLPLFYIFKIESLTLPPKLVSSSRQSFCFRLLNAQSTAIYHHGQFHFYFDLINFNSFECQWNRTCFNYYLIGFSSSDFLIHNIACFFTIYSTFLVFMITFSISSYYLIGRVILLICFALYFIFKTDFIELQTFLCILRTKWCFLPDCHFCLLYQHRLPSFIVCPEISYIFLLDFLKSSLWIFFCP